MQAAIGIILEVPRTIRAIVTSPKLIGYLVVPLLIGAVAYPVLVLVFYIYRTKIGNLILSNAWYPELLGWLVFILGLFVAGIFSFIISSVLGSFFIESAIEEVHKSSGLEINSPQTILSWIKSLSRSLRDSLIQISVFLVIGFLTLILGVVPILAVVPVVIGTFLLGYGLFDLPLALLQLSFRKRLKIGRLHKFEVLVTGGLFSLALCIPLGGLLLFPVFYLLAARTIAGWPEVRAALQEHNESFHA